jgi:hypothetical protein
VAVTYVLPFPPPSASLATRFPRPIEKLSQLWRGRAVEDALLGEEGGAVKHEWPRCSKEWLFEMGELNHTSKHFCIHFEIVNLFYYDEPIKS